MSVKSKRMSLYTRLFCFICVPLVVGCAIEGNENEFLEGNGVSETEFSWSYDRNFIDYCVSTDVKNLNTCILEAACHNLSSTKLKRVYDQAIQKGIEPDIEGEKFYWSGVSKRGKNSAIELLNNLCSDFYFSNPDDWHPNPASLELPNDITIPNTGQPVDDRWPASSNKRLNQNLSSRLMPKVVRSFDTQTEIPVETNDGRFNSDLPDDLGTKVQRSDVANTFYNENSIYLNQHCAENYGSSVFPFYDTKKFVSLLIQEGCYQKTPDGRLSGALSMTNYYITDRYEADDPPEEDED